MIAMPTFINNNWFQIIIQLHLLVVPASSFLQQQRYCILCPQHPRITTLLRPGFIATTTSASFEDDNRGDADDDQAVLEWLEENQADGSCGSSDRRRRRRIRISTDKEGLRGLVVTQDTEADETLLVVPLDLCLRNSQAPDWSSTLPKKVRLAVRVMEIWNNGDNSEDSKSNYKFWKPFLNSWPGDIQGLPETLPDEEIQREAQCETLVQDIRKHKQYVREQHEKILELAPPETTATNNIPLRTFQRILYLVGSRCIAVSPSESILAPVVDMANHSPTPSARYQLIGDEDGDRSSIALIAAHAMKAGDGVTISYGQNCNRILAGGYGFCPDNNPFDFELVSLVEILQAAKDAGLVLNRGGEDVFALERSVSDLGLPTTNFRLFAESGPEEELLLSLRAALMDDEGRDEIAKILEAIEDDEADEEDLYVWTARVATTAVGVADVLRAACRILEGTLGGRHTTLEEDERILAAESNTMSPGSKLLVKLRMERKKLFRSVANNVETSIGR